MGEVRAIVHAVPSGEYSNTSLPPDGRNRSQRIASRSYGSVGLDDSPGSTSASVIAERIDSAKPPADSSVSPRSSGREISTNTPAVVSGAAMRVQPPCASATVGVGTATSAPFDSVSAVIDITIEPHFEHGVPLVNGSPSPGSMQPTMLLPSGVIGSLASGTPASPDSPPSPPVVAGAPNPIRPH